MELKGCYQSEADKYSLTNALMPAQAQASVSVERYSTGLRTTSRCSTADRDMPKSRDYKGLVRPSFSMELLIRKGPLNPLRDKSRPSGRGGTRSDLMGPQRGRVARGDGGRATASFWTSLRS